MKFERSIFVNPMLSLYNIDCIQLGFNASDIAHWFSHCGDAVVNDYWTLSTERNARQVLQPEQFQISSRLHDMFWWAFPAKHQGRQQYSIVLDQRLMQHIQCSHLIVEGKVLHTFENKPGIKTEDVLQISAPLISLDYSEPAAVRGDKGLRIYDWDNFNLNQWRSS